MIWKTRETEPARRENLAGGSGGAWCVQPVTGDNAVAGSRFHMIGRISLDPGAGVGEHLHARNEEVYIVSEGHGTYFDNGEWRPVGPGDIMICYQGQLHALTNTGTTPLVFYGLIAE